MMHNLKKYMTSALAAVVLCNILLVGGCGARQTPGKSSDDNAVQSISFAPENVAEDTTVSTVEGATGNMADNAASAISGEIEDNTEEDATDKELDAVISGMTMDEKISQMIIPAIRTWNGVNVTDLSASLQLAEALRKHQYCGIILFGANITGAEQATRLVNDLQNNNLQIEGVSAHIPYLMPVDQEGGIVIRLGTGTRMTGNMAIGATESAAQNAEITGRILGEEIAAIGFNADFAPVIDVNNNPGNPVIGTRSFSDDPETVAELGIAYSKGLSSSGVIAAFKHYPGHGDTETDSHIGTPSVKKTYEELKKNELVPFKSAIENGADMIMTAHITYPLIDEEKTFADGTKGYFPATMSKKMITDILRTDLGFDGVVVTDGLEMGAIRTAGFVPGKENSAEYGVGIAAEVINAGVDILLIPLDLTSDAAANFYDDYIAGITTKVEDGEISKDRIDESVKRILKLKVKYGIFNPSEESQDLSPIDDKVARSKEIVGSKEHHEKELEIARQAITVVKNDEGLLPINDDTQNVVMLGRLKGDVTDKIAGADYVVAFSYASGNSTLDKNDPQNKAIQKAIADTHKAGGKFILISENLPYDAAVYQDADAIVLAYMGPGLNVDPTKDKVSDTGMSAQNANIAAAIETIFGENSPKGHLPVNIPVVEEQPDGTLKYGTEYLYERGFGLTY